MIGSQDHLQNNDNDNNNNNNNIVQWESLHLNYLNLVGLIETPLTHSLLILVYMKELCCCVCAVPPAPNDIRVLSRHSHYLIIQWQAPYPPHGVITQYLLKYWPKGRLYSVPMLVVLPPTVQKYNMSALRPNVVYSIQVF